MIGLLLLSILSFSQKNTTGYLTGKWKITHVETTIPLSDDSKKAEQYYRLAEYMKLTRLLFDGKGKMTDSIELELFTYSFPRENQIQIGKNVFEINKIDDKKIQFIKREYQSKYKTTVTLLKISEDILFLPYSVLPAPSELNPCQNYHADSARKKEAQLDSAFKAIALKTEYYMAIYESDFTPQVKKYYDTLMRLNTLTKNYLDDFKNLLKNNSISTYKTKRNYSEKANFYNRIIDFNLAHPVYLYNIDNYTNEDCLRNITTCTLKQNNVSNALAILKKIEELYAVYFKK